MLQDPIATERTNAAAATSSSNGLLTGPSPTVLMAWGDPTIALAVWTRTLPATITARLDALAFDALPHGHFTTTAADAQADIERQLSRPRGGDATLLQALVADMSELIALYCKATGAHKVETRLDAIRDNACRLFHVDCTAARLVTSYVGPGTQWVHRADAARALSEQERYGGPIQQLDRCAVGLMAGSGSTCGGLVHRSPPIQATGQVRLFFCVNSPIG